MIIHGLYILIISLVRLGTDKVKSITSLKYLGGAVGVTALTIILLFYHLPIRFAFLATKGSFKTIVESESFSPEDYGNQRIGIWFVDKCESDSRGGVYFRIGTSPAGGPDTLSHGFVYKPKHRSSPFGMAGYQLVNMTERWHYFTVSNDF